MRAAAVLSLALLAVPANAADDPICADRPGKSTGTCTVPEDHWQLETGLADWSLQKGGGERETALLLGETVVKYGLSQRSEIAVEVTPWQRSGGASGFGDLIIFYKHRLATDGAALQIAAMPFVKVPAAKRGLGNGKLEGGLLVPIGYSIPNWPFSISLTPEVDWLSDAGGHGHHAAMAQVATLGWQASRKLNFSAELWGQWDWGPTGTVRQASADGAVAYLLSNDVQLDAGANFGLNQTTPDVELYAGVSMRF